MKETRGHVPPESSWGGRTRLGFWPKAFIAGSSVLGIEPLFAGKMLRNLDDLAWFSPGLFAALSWICLGQLAWKRQLRWIALGAGVATGVFTGCVVWVSPAALALLPAPGWFPWLVLWGALPGTLRWAWSWSSPLTRGLSTFCIVGMAYLISAALCFLPWTNSQAPDVEQLDSVGRTPALGPGVSWVGRLVCLPRGPSSVLDRDYSGSEWIWVAYRPLVRLWFARPSASHYYPYARMPVNR